MERGHRRRPFGLLPMTSRTLTFTIVKWGLIIGFPVLVVVNVGRLAYDVLVSLF